MTNIQIRNAQLDDAPQIRNIYAGIVEETPISFEIQAPNLDEIQRRMQAAFESHCYLVAELNQQLVGYAYGSYYRAREAYRNTVETSIYLDTHFHGRGIGTTLYKRLLMQLGELNFHTAVAGIYVPNPASEALHKRVGFKRIGRMKEVGYKFDKWHDVEW